MTATRRMRIVAISITTGVLAFLFALPPAYLLADLRIPQTPTWASIAAIVAAMSTLIWKIRNPAKRITGIVAIAISLLSFFVTVLAFAIDGNQAWPTKLFFVTWSMVFVSGYAVVAGLVALKILSRVEERH